MGQVGNQLWLHQSLRNNMDHLSLSGCLYLIRLNKTSFAPNPGRMELPAGRYIAEVRDGLFHYQTGYAADVEVSHVVLGKRRTARLPDLGRFGKMEVAMNAYQGLAIEFTHEGGQVDVYNPRPSNQYYGKCEGEVVVAIWNAEEFGASLNENGFKGIEKRSPSSEVELLVIAANPKLEPYKNDLSYNLSWQSDLLNIGKYHAVIFPIESFQILHMVRDNKCIEEYIKMGGRVFLVGSSMQYLSYYNILPLKLPEYLGEGEFNTVAVSSGDALVSNDTELMSFSNTITIPMIKASGQATLKNTKEWCAIKRNEVGAGKVVWASYFMTNIMRQSDGVFSENWNKMIVDQIEWLIK